MNDLVPTARAAGKLWLHDLDVLSPDTDVVDLRRRVGIVFQKPNPFPKSVYDNAAYGPRLHLRLSRAELDELVESALRKAAVWNEVKDRLRKPALGLVGGTMGKATVLVVEDDRSLVEVLEYNLKQAGYDVLLAYDGQDGITQAQLKHPDVVILDLMLPVVDGLDVCRRLRADPATRNTRIIMLTAKAEESDELVGFSLGADDYVTKPFSVKVLLERIKALGRRESDAASAQLVSCRGVIIDPVRHRVTVDGQPVHLTRNEFRLLETIARQPGRVFTRAELIGAALGGDAIVLERTIDVHVRAVRRKLGKQAVLIETVRGVGYRFRDPAD